MEPAAAQSSDVKIQEGNGHATQLWKNAGHQIKVGLIMSSNFSTLRDQYDVNPISKTQLKTVKRLGEGAFAVVEKCEYLAPEASAPVIVAVKKLKPDVLKDPTEVESFIKECGLLRKLKHNHVIQYLGLGSEDESSEAAARSSLFLVEEFLGGGTLKQLVSADMSAGSPTYTNQEALTWCMHVADALAYLHSASPRVIHRDLKMENILLSSNRKQAKLADFGLAALTKKARPARKPIANDTDITHRQDQTYDQAVERMRSNVRSKSQLLKSPSRAASRMATGLGAMAELSGKTGTLMYMAPEMYRSEAYDHKVDVFSFALIMYELFSRYLTICAISNAGTEEEIEQYVQRVSQGYRPSLDALEWPDSFKAVLQACWAQNPQDRPEMSEVVKRLKAVQQEGFPEQVRIALCECTIS